MYHQENANDLFVKSQKLNHSLETFYFESDDKEYFVNLTCTDFDTKSDEDYIDENNPKYMWLVDWKTPKSSSDDNEFFSIYENGLEWFEEKKKEIMKHNLMTRQQTMGLLGV